MDIRVANKTNKSRKIVYVVKVRQLFSNHRICKIVSSVALKAVQTEKM